MPILVFLATSAVWSPSLRNGFAWDDRQLIVENDRLVQDGAIGRAFQEDFWDQDDREGRSDYYRPIITTSYIVDRSIWGLDPRGFHATNVAVHGLAAALLTVLLSAWGLPRPWAAAAALAWAVHPAMAESVAWVSGRTDVIASAFVFVFLRLDSLGGRSRRFFAPWALAGGLWSKEIAVFSPAIAVVRDLLAGSSLRRALGERVPQILVVVAWFLCRRAVLGAATAATEVETSLSGGLRLLSLLHLPGVLVLPWRGRIEYGAGLPSGPLWLTAIVGAACVGWLVVRAWRPSSSPVRLLAFAGAATYAPAFAAVVLKGVIADRLLYLPAAFALPAMALTLAPVGPRSLRALGLAAALGTLTTEARIPWWLSERTLFERALRAPHPSARVHLNLAIALHDDGLLVRSWQELGLAMAELNIESAWYTRGLLETEIGCYDLAIRDYETALTIAPSYVPAANNLGALLAEIGRPAAARQVLAEAVRRSEADPVELRMNLQGLASDTGPDAAEDALDPALRCGELAGAVARIADARHLNRRALERMRKQQISQAGILVHAALDRDPQLVAAWLNLAQWQLLQGRHEGARSAVGEALRIEPGQPDALRLGERIDAERRAEPPQPRR